MTWLICHGDAVSTGKITCKNCRTGHLEGQPPWQCLA